MKLTYALPLAHNIITINTVEQRWHGPLMVRFLGGTLRLNERAADDIFSSWISPSRYETPANVKKIF